MSSCSLPYWRTGGPRYAERHYPGPVLPRRYHCPPAGSPHQAAAGGAVHCGPVPGQGLGGLRYAHAGSGGVHDPVPHQPQKHFQGPQAHDLHHCPHRRAEHLLHHRHPHPPRLDHYLGGHRQGHPDGAAHRAADYRHLPSDLHHQPHCPDRWAGAAAEPPEKAALPGA